MYWWPLALNGILYTVATFLFKELSGSFSLTLASIASAIFFAINVVIFFKLKIVWEYNSFKDVVTSETKYKFNLSQHKSLKTYVVVRVICAMSGGFVISALFSALFVEFFEMHYAYFVHVDLSLALLVSAICQAIIYFRHIKVNVIYL